MIRYIYLFDLIPADGVLTDADAFRTGLPVATLGRQRWYYTSHDDDIELASPFGPAAFLPSESGTQTYIGRTRIKHAAFRLDETRANGQMTVVLDAEVPVVDLFQLDAPPGRLFLYIGELAPGSSSPVSHYTGEVLRCDLGEGGSEFTAQLTCTPMTQLLQVEGLQLKHPELCPWSLFDARTCKVNRNAHADGAYFAYREDGVVTSVAPGGVEITVPAAANRADEFFDGGFAVFNGNYDPAHPHIPRSAGNPGVGQAHAVGGGRKRDIALHEGGAITLKTPLLDIGPGALVTLYPGCKKREQEDCKTRYGNVIHVGGYARRPKSNPFTEGLK